MIEPARLIDDLVLLLAAPAVGSFLGSVILRLPAGQPLLAARSACPHCGHRLRPRDMIPFLGWAWLHGRCRHCRGRLGLFYPVVELAALAVAVWSVLLFPGWLAWASAALGWTLLVAGEIDRRHLWLPDSLVLPLIPAGPLVLWATAGAGQIPAGVLGAAAGFAFMAAAAWLYRRVRGREGLGLGDAKLFAAAGAWTTTAGLPGVLLIAAVSGLAAAALSGRRDGRLSADRVIPFGPFLALGFWLTWSFGPVLLVN